MAARRSATVWCKAASASGTAPTATGPAPTAPQPGLEQHLRGVPGTGGTVTVNGSHAITGLQFAGNGYTLNGGIGGELLTSAGATNVRVDTGNTATLA
nr:hypothetical protein [Pseudomonas bharatica]